MKASTALSELLIPVSSSASGAILRSTSQWRADEAGLRVLESRARTGRMPRDRAEAGAALDDPCAPGQKLEAELGAGRVAIWSVGPDGAGGSGAVGMREDGRRSDDLVFFCPNSERENPAKAARQPPLRLRRVAL